MKNRYSEILSILSALIFLCVASELRYLTVAQQPPIIIVIVVFFAIFCQIAASIGLAVLAMQPISCLHSLKTALYHFVISVSGHVMSNYQFRKTIASTKQVAKIQHSLLMDILRKNADTEYGRKYLFSGVKTVNEFREKIPLTTYEDYRPYVDRIAEKGEQNLLTSDQVIKLCVSAGTTGKSKLLPFGASLMKFFNMEVLLPIIYRMANKGPWAIAPLKAFFIEYVPKWRTSPSGLPCGPASAYPGKKPLIISLGMTTPPEAMAYMTEPAQSYIHWLFALIDENVKHVICGFGGTLLVNFQFLEKNWKQLASDIRHGRLTNKHNIPPEIVAEVKKLAILRPNPSRADAIEEACSKGFEGIASRLWPKLNAMSAVVTGAHAIYRDHLKWFAGRDVRILSHFYGASEAVFAAPLTTEQEDNYTYTLLPRLSFMEFIPETDISNEKPTTLLAHQLEIGQRYEIVTTSYQGFCRYRMGDLVLVVAFYNEAPVIEFCSRVGGILDLRGEKTSEDMIVSALKTAVLKWQDCRGLADFTVTDSLTLETSCNNNNNNNNTSGQLYYVVFVELTGASRPLTDDEIAAFDNALSSVSYPYKSFRDKEAISMAKVFVVPQGTFETLKRRFLESNNAVSNQFKPPRYQKRPDDIKFLVDSSYNV